MLDRFLLQADVVPWKLWFAVGCLLVTDIILLVIWTAVDPLSRVVHNFEKEPSLDPEEDIEIQPQLEHCKSNHHSIWMGKLLIIYSCFYLAFSKNPQIRRSSNSMENFLINIESPEKTQSY